MRFLALDFETGGTDPNKNAPVQLGVSVFEDGEPGASMEWLIGPTFHWKTGKCEREYTVAALEVSGISWPKIKAAPAPKAIVAELSAWAFANDAVNLPVVAFNAPFDLAFYSTLMFLASDWHPSQKGVKVQPEPPLLGPWQCALMLARAELHGLDDYRLDTVAGHFGLSRKGEAHGALEDAILAGRVYMNLLGLRSVAA